MTPIIDLVTNNFIDWILPFVLAIGLIWLAFWLGSRREKRLSTLPIVAKSEDSKYRASHHVRNNYIDLKLELERFGEMASDEIICVVQDPKGVNTFSEKKRGLYFFKDVARGLMGAAMETEINFQYPRDFGDKPTLKMGEHMVTWRFKEGFPLLKSCAESQYVGGHSEIVATDKFTVELIE